jgi:phytoene dehydrogenase-like protein
VEARSHSDVAIVGGGHNALVAAALLGRGGLSVSLFERLDRLGGAAVSTRPFAGVDAVVSPYAYLVSLFPGQLGRALGARLQLRRRRPESCTPEGEGALVIDRLDPEGTARSFASMGSAGEHRSWVAWQRLVDGVASVVAPTLLEPLRPASWFERRLGSEAWELVAGRPLGESLEETFDSDLVRGVVLSDGLIGTFAHSRQASLCQNRCWLYHVTGDGSGTWRVPVGGMGALSGELVRVATGAGARVHTGTEVVSLRADGRRAELLTAAGERHTARAVLCGAAPAVLERLLGASGPASDLAPSSTRRPPAEGAQVKVNMVVRRLPRLSCGTDPALAFTGTLHVNERHSQLDAAWARAAGGELPDPVPCELYCHSLSDPSVLGAGLRRRHPEAHSLSLFALQTPARLFGPGGADGEVALRACLDSFQQVLAEPLSECLLETADGRPCLEVHTPADLQGELALPGGNIFHGELQWPWAEDDAEVGRWGTETEHANVFLCGSGARRGGAVSGIGGHNAAMAALEWFGRQP